MQLQKTGDLNDLFINELRIRLAKKNEPKAIETKALEQALEEIHEDVKGDAKQGTTEQRLNEASKENYPHRNPEAYEKTGDTRPINALPEELGKLSGEAKDKRYQDKRKEGAKDRLVDKDIGKQRSPEAKASAAPKKQVVASMTKWDEIKLLESFVSKLPEGGYLKNFFIGIKDKLINMIKNDQLPENFMDVFDNASTFNKEPFSKNISASYLEYRKTNASKYNEVKDLDGMIASINEKAFVEKRDLTNDEKAKIIAAKIRKTEIFKQE